MRNVILEVLNRMPHSETLKAYVVDLMKLSMEAGTIKHPIAYHTYIEDRFVRAATAAPIPL